MVVLEQRIYEDVMPIAKRDRRPWCCRDIFLQRRLGIEMESKKNVEVFNADVQGGGYIYSDKDRLSSKLSNERINAAMVTAYDFRGKSVIDLGCGDGTYTVDLALAGAAKVVGVEPAAAAVARAQKLADSLNLSSCVFRVGSIYDLKLRDDVKDIFDVAILRGVLHHLPDPQKAVALAVALAPVVMIVEPNGLNPVVKMLERFSAYHLRHEEQSFLPRTIDAWCEDAGAKIERRELINLVPMFCPDWMAHLGLVLGPLVESLPLVRGMLCGQYVVVAHRHANPTSGE